VGGSSKGECSEWGNAGLDRDCGLVNGSLTGNFYPLNEFGEIVRPVNRQATLLGIC